MRRLLSLVLLLLVFGLAACAPTEEVSNDSGGPSPSTTDSTSQSSTDEELLLDAQATEEEPLLDNQAACDETNAAVGELNQLLKGLVDDAGEFLPDDTASANDAIRKYAPEIGRVAEDLALLKVADPGLAGTVDRVADAQSAWANKIEEGLFGSENTEAIMDEALFSMIELQGACDR